MKRFSKDIFVRILAVGFFIIFLFIFRPAKYHISSLSSEDGIHYTCEYDEMTRKFIECAPENADSVKGLIFMLHGYGSTGEAFMSEVALEKEANPRGYVVVYVTGSRNPEDKTASTGWNSGLGTSSVNDIGFLKELAAYYQKKYSLGKDETFVAGFSNGAFMTYKVALEGSDYFAGVASVAGMMPQSLWDAKKAAPAISVLQINGTKDDVVPMNLTGSSQFSKAPAIEEVIEYFVSGNKLACSENTQLSKQAALTKYTGSKKNIQVWNILIEDGRHSWPEEETSGFDCNQLIVDFFDSLLK